jgi:hypothetical protein
MKSSSDVAAHLITNQGIVDRSQFGTGRWNASRAG